MKAWEEFLRRQEQEIGQATVKQWLRPLRIAGFDACNIYLEAQDPFQANWFEEHIRKKIKDGLYNNNQNPVKVHLHVIKQGNKEKPTKKRKDFKEDVPPFRISFDTLDSNCTFDSFITSKENLLPYKALLELTLHVSTKNEKKDPLQNHPTFNPLFLYGKQGAGKSHLLMAATLAYRKAGLNALYVRAETFTDHVVHAIRAGEMSIFRSAYRSADVLIVDDIHTFGRKAATQEEFFHTFNTLHIAGKQLILSAACSPKDLEHIEPRLVSRFEWGLALPLEIPTRDVLYKILEAKSKQFNITLRPKAATFLIDTFKSGPRALVQALEALILRTHKEGVASAQALEANAHLLADLMAAEEKRGITPELIMKAVAEHFGVKVEDLTGDSQSREYTLPRQVAIHLLRRKLNLPFMKIGDLFGRDHSTIMASCRRIEKALGEEDPKIVPSWFAIEKKM
jgi:chromosomal replication initiator protein